MTITPDRFTAHATAVMSFADREARRSRHEFLGPEHILLGILAQGKGVAPYVLKGMGIDLGVLRLKIEQQMQIGPSVVTRATLEPTNTTIEVFKAAFAEAANLGHNYLGTEHMLLGILREGKSKAAHALSQLGVKLEDAREEVLEFLGQEAD